MRIMLTVIEGHKLEHTSRYNVLAGHPQVITHRPDYLVSPGQQCDLVVQASVMDEKDAGLDLVGSALVWAVQDSIHAHVPMTWDYSHIPSRRSLDAILKDAVQHGKDNPKHGTDCVCMDALSYEIYHHVLKAIGDDYVAERDETSDQRTRRIDAKMRVAHLFHMIGRKL